MARTYELACSGDQTVTIDFPEPREGEAVFVVAGHKTGSVLLNNIIKDIAGVTYLPIVPVEERLWAQGINLKDWPQDVFNLMEQEGFVYISFRDLQKLPALQSFQNGKRVFMIRDPRDVAVSYFFSMKKSHVIPKSGEARESILKMRDKTAQLEIDDFILRGMANRVLENIQSFSRFLNTENTVFYRYEDVIFNKVEWVAQIAENLDVSIPQSEVLRIAKKHDIRPEKENPNAHIRSVTPGGYREKLSSDSIAYIQEKFPIFFDRYGYSKDT